MSLICIIDILPEDRHSSPKKKINHNSPSALFFSDYHKERRSYVRMSSKFSLSLFSHTDLGSIDYMRGESESERDHDS